MICYCDNNVDRREGTWGSQLGAGLSLFLGVEPSRLENLHARRIEKPPRTRNLQTRRIEKPPRTRNLDEELKKFHARRMEKPPRTENLHVEQNRIPNPTKTLLFSSLRLRLQVASVTSLQSSITRTQCVRPRRTQKAGQMSSLVVPQGPCSQKNVRKGTVPAASHQRPNDLFR